MICRYLCVCVTRRVGVREKLTILNSSEDTYENLVHDSRGAVIQE